MYLFEIDNTPISEALYDFNDSCNECISEYYINSVLVENGFEPDILFEGVGDVVNNVIEYIRELGKKIFEWFRNIYERIRDFCSDRKKHLEKHEKEIDENIETIDYTNIKNFTYYNSNNFVDTIDKTLLQIVYICKKYLDKFTDDFDEKILIDIKDYLEDTYKISFSNFSNITKICNLIRDKFIIKYDKNNLPNKQEFDQIINDMKMNIKSYNKYNMIIKNMEKEVKSLIHTIETEFQKVIENEFRDEDSYDIAYDYIVYLRKFINLIFNMITKLTATTTEYILQASEYSTKFFNNVINKTEQTEDDE